MLNGPLDNGVRGNRVVETCENEELKSVKRLQIPGWDVDYPQQICRHNVADIMVNACDRCEI